MFLSPGRGQKVVKTPKSMLYEFHSCQEMMGNRPDTIPKKYILGSWSPETILLSLKSSQLAEFESGLRQVSNVNFQDFDR